MRAHAPHALVRCWLHLRSAGDRAPRACRRQEAAGIPDACPTGCDISGEQGKRERRPASQQRQLLLSSISLSFPSSSHSFPVPACLACNSQCLLPSSCLLLPFSFGAATASTARITVPTTWPARLPFRQHYLPTCPPPHYRHYLACPAATSLTVVSLPAILPPASSRLPTALCHSPSAHEHARLRAITTTSTLRLHLPALSLPTLHLQYHAGLPSPPRLPHIFSLHTPYWQHADGRAGGVPCDMKTYQSSRTILLPFHQHDATDDIPCFSETDSTYHGNDVDILSLFLQY